MHLVSMTVICVLLRQSRCGLLNYIGGRGTSSQLALAAYFVVALEKVITGTWQLRLTNR